MDLVCGNPFRDRSQMCRMAGAAHVKQGFGLSFGARRLSHGLSDPRFEAVLS